MCFFSLKSLFYFFTINNQYIDFVGANVIYTCKQHNGKFTSMWHNKSNVLKLIRVESYIYIKSCAPLNRQLFYFFAFTLLLGWHFSIKKCQQERGRENIVFQ